jgi:hypothetical protein
MPSLARIAGYWSDLDVTDLAAAFPYLDALAIGWDEPFCFRCGWLAPVVPAASNAAWGACWNAAAGWLERCHLYDHALGGSSDVANLIPMCPLCHREQPPFDSPEMGIAFVNSRSIRRRALEAFVQAYTDKCYTGRRPGGSRQALRLLERAYAEVGTLYVQHLPQGLAA